MILLLSIYAAIANSQPAEFEMTFVRLSVRDHIKLVDARADLSAVGSTWFNMIDSMPSIQICVVKGSPIKSPWWFWPNRLGEEGTVHGVVTDNNPFIAGFDSTKMRHQAYIKSARLRVKKGNDRDLQPHPSATFTEPTGITTFNDSWFSKNMKPPGAKVAWFGEYEKGAKCASGTFVNVAYSLEEVMAPFYDVIPLASTPTGYKNLEAFVSNLDGFVLGEILWVDSSGWLIVAARKDKKVGLAWLKPHPRHS